MHAKSWLLLIGITSTMLSGGRSAAAQAPALLTHHGFASYNNVPIEGPIEITFSLYDDTTTTSHLWQETLTVTCQSGYYAITLGTSEPLAVAVLAEHPEVFLGLAIAGGDELSPRLRLTSVPYSLVAQQAGDLACAACVDAPEVAFGYAGSATAGGPAADLECNAPAGCIQTTELVNGAVTAAKLADSSVTTATLGDGAVTPAKLASCPANQLLRFGSGGWQCTDALQISDSGQVSATGNIIAPNTAKAWAVFNGGATTPITPLATSGVSSIVRNSTGLWRITWAQPFASASYVVLGTCNMWGFNGAQFGLEGNNIPASATNGMTAAYATVGCRDTSNTGQNSDLVMVMAFGQ